MSHRTLTTSPLDAFAPELCWHNGEPEEWNFDEENGTLEIRLTPQLDYWSRTFYSPCLKKHDGQTLIRTVGCDEEVTLTTCFTLKPRAQFDQAGVIILVDDNTWVKAGIEYCDGVPRLSCVVTNEGFSDWSTQRYDNWDENEKATSVRVRVHKLSPGSEQGPCVVFEAAPYHAGDTADSPASWAFVRIASLRSEAPWQMGIFCFAPMKQAGCRAQFHHFRIGPKADMEHSGDSSAMKST